MKEGMGYIWPNLSGGPVVTDGQGIDYLIVLPGQTRIEVHFLKDVTVVLEHKENYRIQGGERVTSVAVTGAAKVAHDVVELTLDRFGDWAPYRLRLAENIWEEAGIDPVFSGIDFSFKINCPNDIDCRSHPPGFERFPALKNFDYQAKDYESFKQAMLDRLPSTIPQWWDRAEADFGIALVDLLAYAGDRLSYYQDRVAAESQLATARARESVSGHLKLIDYVLDPGETAKAYLYFEVYRDMTIPARTEVETPALSYETPVTFTLEDPFPAYNDLNRLDLYDFSHPSLFIPQGACQVTVVGHPEGLDEGSRLVIRQDDEADVAGMHLVELNAKPVFKKATDGTEITVLTWDDSGALPWDVSVSKGSLLGNIAELSHGTRYSASLYADGTVESYDLPEGPLGYQDGRPMIAVRVDGEVWTRVASLKESQAWESHYQVVDLDDGKNRVLFGDNVNGLRPEKYALVEIEYQAGLGAAGNVAAGTLSRLPQEVRGIKSAWNPFAGWNGRDAESEEHAKLWGPKKNREQERAVTPEDYAREAMTVPGISRAMARFVWTGSWVTVRVTLDPQGTELLSEELRQEVYDYLMSRKMAGYDIQIFPVRYVPLEVSVRFCLHDLAFRDQVLRDLTSALGNGVGADGVKGFFHADNWTFGQAVTLSGLYAATARVPGIECAEVLVFKRLRKPPGDEITEGAISMQWDEIAQLDNDRDFPERGRMDLLLVGGR